jgi:hypothetical protein
MTTLQQSRAKLALLVAATTIAAIVLALFAAISTAATGLWAFVLIALFAPLALACAVVAMKAALMWQTPAILTLDATGIVFTRAGIPQSFAWDEIANAEVLAPGSRSRAACLVLKEPRNGRRYISIGRFWEQSADEIVEAVTEAKAASSAP